MSRCTGDLIACYDYSYSLDLVLFDSKSYVRLVSLIFCLKICSLMTYVCNVYCACNVFFLLINVNARL